MVPTFKAVAKAGNAATMTPALTALAALSTGYDAAKVSEVR